MRGQGHQSRLVPASPAYTNAGVTVDSVVLHCFITRAIAMDYMHNAGQL
jgi:hypothetical protein